MTKTNCSSVEFELFLGNAMSQKEACCIKSHHESNESLKNTWNCHLGCVIVWIPGNHGRILRNPLNFDRLIPNTFYTSQWIILWFNRPFPDSTQWSWSNHLRAKKPQSSTSQGNRALSRELRRKKYVFAFISHHSESWHETKACMDGIHRHLQLFPLAFTSATWKFRVYALAHSIFALLFQLTSHAIFS